MKAFITEDNIELALMDVLEKQNHYEIIHCSSAAEDKEKDDPTGRTNKRQCILPKVMRESLCRINPGVDEALIDKTIQRLTEQVTEHTLLDHNYANYKMLRDGVTEKFRKNGKEDFATIRLIDYDNPLNNTFTAVNQMWIEGTFHWRRPDVLLFVNGMPLVFIELKNDTVKVKQAYEKNLKSYIKDIPDLFALNQICILSNGLESRVGAYNAGYEFFFEWLRHSEGEKIDREAIMLQKLSLPHIAESLLKPETLIDYIENFIVFDNKHIKIIAKNHQYFGVNNLYEALERREELNGKIGVFWHTQGSGKSYSMVMFARKVNRKMHGNFTFLIVTDRTDLDTQIYKNFLRTEVIGANEECQPKNSEQLREYLKGNKAFIFSLVHKFGWDKVQKGEYPVLSTRNDIIVMIDEAHRTQYNTLGENMHAALPNANFIAFTGTPLLGTKRKTNQWFGDYVSEYNFAQSIEDGATVPLFYSQRVPTVELQNNYLQDDMVDLINKEDLNDAEVKRLENSGAKILEVIKRDNRLEKIAEDIVVHFTSREFRGKGMVVSVDKFTTVAMYDKVKKYWEIERQKTVKARNEAKDIEERTRLNDKLNYMDSVEMAVIVSEEADEEKKFKEKGLDIVPHRKKMNEITPEGLDIEDRFKDPNDKLQLVFVCAMWLTGFDVPSISTLYLDKPMKGHTLMQCIARANRCFPNKVCGLIVDYVNVFKWMKEALSEYAISPDDDTMPVKDIEELLRLLDESIMLTVQYLKEIGIEIMDSVDLPTFEKEEMLRKQYAQIIANDEHKNRVKVHLNTMMNIFEASKPEVFELHWSNTGFPVLQKLHKWLYNSIDDEKLEKAKLAMAKVLNDSVNANDADDKIKYEIRNSKVINLAKLDVEEIRKEIHKAEYKPLVIDDLKKFIEQALKQMIEQNTERVLFAERYKSIIDRYNSGSEENEAYYDQLVKLIEDLKKETARALEEGMTEEELEIYDLLIKGKKLSKAELQSVKLAAKNLYQKLSTQKTILLVVDWYKDAQTKAKVRDAIEKELDADLPMETYDKESFESKTDLILNHFIDMSVQGYGWIAA